VRRRFKRIIIDELVNIIYLDDLDRGIVLNMRKQNILDYINNNETNSQEIYYWLLNNQDNSTSIYLLGYFNYHGIETNMNKQKSIELYQISAKLENTVAQLELATMYLDEKDEKKYGKVFELFKKLAERENPYALYMLGYCYDYGIGIKVNKKESKELYKKATKLGYSDALLTSEINKLYNLADIFDYT
jgi:TPR repeat protein